MKGVLKSRNMNLNDWLTIVYISAATVSTIYTACPTGFNEALTTG